MDTYNALLFLMIFIKLKYCVQRSYISIRSVQYPFAIVIQLTDPFCFFMIKAFTV